MSTLDKWEQSHNFDEFTDFQIVEMLDEADAARGITNGCILALGIWSVLAAIAIGFCILTQVLK